MLYKTNLNKYKEVFFTYFMNKIEIQAIFFIFNTNPRFPPFLLYVRCKSGVTFIRRSFRDVVVFVIWYLFFFLFLFYLFFFFIYIYNEWTKYRILTYREAIISVAYISEDSLSLFVFSSSWCQWKAVINAYGSSCICHSDCRSRMHTISILITKTYKPPHDKTNKVACAPSEDSDQSGRPPGLIRDFAVRVKKATHWAHSKDSDQTGHMPRLIQVFAGRTCHFVGFVIRRLI